MQKSWQIIILLACIFIAAPCAFATGQKPLKIRVYMDWITNVEEAGMLTAIDEGLYRKEGLEIIPIFKDLNIIDRVLNNEADIGLHSGIEVIKYRSKGKPIQAFAAKYQLNAHCIIVRRASDIHNILDLKGKKFAYVAPQELEILKIVLGKHGMSLSDINLVNIPLDLESVRKKLSDGEIDAVLGWEFNWPVTMALLGEPVRTIPTFENGFYYYGIVYFAKSDYIKQHKEELAKFIRITFNSWKRVLKSPDYYAHYIMQKWYPKSWYIGGDRQLTEKQEAVELKLRRAYFMHGVGENGIGIMNPLIWNVGVQKAEQYGIIPKDSVDPNEVYTDTVLKLVYGAKL